MSIMAHERIILSHPREKTKTNMFLYFFTELKTYHLSYFYPQT